MGLAPMSSPRVVIAHAIAKTDTDDDWTWLGMADAVIDALEGMGISPEMDLAARKVSREHELDLQPGDALALWQAMVGAMRDEL